MTGTCEALEDVKSPVSIQINILVRGSIDRTRKLSIRNSCIQLSEPVGNGGTKGFYCGNHQQDKEEKDFFNCRFLPLNISHYWCDFNDPEEPVENPPR